MWQQWQEQWGRWLTALVDIITVPVFDEGHLLLRSESVDEESLIILENHGGDNRELQSPTASYFQTGTG